MVRFAIIGTNFITERLLDAAKLCDDFRLTTVYSRSLEKAQQFAEQWGAEFATDSLDAVAESPDVDAVYIASPNSSHAEQTIKMLKSKKHVLCEKPITWNSAQLAEMLCAAQENGVVLMEAMRSAHIPTLELLGQSMEKIGPVRRCVLSYCQYSSRYDKFKAGVIENAFNPTLYNGALMDIGVYCVHMMVMLFGMPKEICAKGWFLPHSIDAYGSAICSYDGMCVQLAYSKINQSNTPSEIQGEKGTIRFSPTATPYEVSIEYNDSTKEELSFDVCRRDMLYEIQEFIRIVHTGDSCNKWNDYSVMAMAVMDEMRRQIGIDFTIQ
ncbi:Gfo/Idh/MocA family oxidoreductase [Oscillospiraceae bacterium PP1C4]